ncbi:hypothetical protein SAMN05443144_113131 [Fodinibius roseus]|uniref:Cyclic nucleotide-binding domain-containing protein n=1 Tax=Fodinibius roseus TaxID=1194090 RepID=A0A1M5EQC0_9BACT|nr:hypothetical protein [Fodinibius roseus]SHF81409.1 hypothetical protein SAMN05443144_113131 [Fodinibius roseus]
MNTDLILQNIDRIVELDSEEAAFFTSLLRAKSVKRKQFLLRKGQIATDTFFVNSGCLRVFKMNEFSHFLYLFSTSSAPNFG